VLLVISIVVTPLLMTHDTKMRQVKSSLGAILPKEITEETSSHRVVAHDPDFDETMKLSRDTRRMYRNALRKLA